MSVSCSQDYLTCSVLPRWGLARAVSAVQALCTHAGTLHRAPVPKGVKQTWLNVEHIVSTIIVGVKVLRTWQQNTEQGAEGTLKITFNTFLRSTPHWVLCCVACTTTRVACLIIPGSSNQSVPLGLEPGLVASSLCSQACAVIEVQEYAAATRVVAANPSSRKISFGVLTYVSSISFQ